MKALGWTIAALAAVAGTAGAAPGCTARSGPHTVALVELYTSEGCSSCPRADRFLGARRAAGLTASQAVLLSLHVDYWNYIGWKDPYSRKAFTERQRWLSDLARTRTIYTPEFFVSGKELRNWDEGLQTAVDRINARPARAHIAMRMTPVSTGLGMQVNASGAAGASLHLALVESGIATPVAAGENRGRTLRHDFVVREWLEPVTLGADGRAQLKQVLAIPASAVRAKLGVAAFVQNEQGEVLQALTMDACSG